MSRPGKISVQVSTTPPRPSRAKGGRPPYPTVLMVKILALQQRYNLTDDALEYQLLDRRSFLQFLDLTESSSIPDAKTIWLSRDRLAQAAAGTLVFDQVKQQLHQHGYLARCGQIIDASLVQAPVQRNKRKHRQALQTGRDPRRRVRLDRIQRSARSKQYQPGCVCRPGDPSAEREENLTEAGWRVQIQRKGSATRGISATQKQRNRRIATPRARVEHMFGALVQMGGKFVRCKGIVRTTLSVHLKAAVYNLTRLVFLKKTGFITF